MWWGWASFLAPWHIIATLSLPTISWHLISFGGLSKHLIELGELLSNIYTFSFFSCLIINNSSLDLLSFSPKMLAIPLFFLWNILPHTPNSNKCSLKKYFALLVFSNVSCPVIVEESYSFSIKFLILSFYPTSILPIWEVPCAKMTAQRNIGFLILITTTSASLSLFLITILLAQFLLSKVHQHLQLHGYSYFFSQPIAVLQLLCLSETSQVII